MEERRRCEYLRISAEAASGATEGERARLDDAIAKTITGLNALIAKPNAEKSNAAATVDIVRQWEEAKQCREDGKPVTSLGLQYPFGHHDRQQCKQVG